MTPDENIQLGIDLAKAFAAFGLMIFAAGFCAGYTHRAWRERRAESRRRQAWLAEQKRLHEERRRLAERCRLEEGQQVTGDHIETLLKFHNHANSKPQ